MCGSSLFSILSNELWVSSQFPKVGFGYGSTCWTCEHFSSPPDLTPKWHFFFLSISLERELSFTTRAISKVLSAKISHYGMSAPIRISSLPRHDVPLDEMWLRLVKTEPAAISVVLQAFVCEKHRDLGVADVLNALPYTFTREASVSEVTGTCSDKS